MGELGELGGCMGGLSGWVVGLLVFLCRVCWLVRCIHQLNTKISVPTDYCRSGIRSIGGNSNQACCVFPFKFKNKIYNTCTKSGFSKFWCSTTSSYDKNKLWGYC